MGGNSISLLLGLSAAKWTVLSVDATRVAVKRHASAAEPTFNVGLSNAPPPETLQAVASSVESQRLGCAAQKKDRHRHVVKLLKAAGKKYTELQAKDQKLAECRLEQSNLTRIAKRLPDADSQSFDCDSKCLSIISRTQGLTDQRGLLTLWSGKANQVLDWEDARYKHKLVVLDHDGPGGRSRTSYGGQSMYLAGGLRNCSREERSQEWNVLSGSFAMAQLDAQQFTFLTKRCEEAFGYIRPWPAPPVPGLAGRNAVPANLWGYSRVPMLIVIGPQWGKKRPPSESVLCRYELPQIVHTSFLRKIIMDVKVVTLAEPHDCGALVSQLLACLSQGQLEALQALRRRPLPFTGDSSSRADNWMIGCVACRQSSLADCIVGPPPWKSMQDYIQMLSEGDWQLVRSHADPKVLPW